MKRLLLSITFIILISGNAAGVISTTGFDFEEPVFTEPGVLVKDHSLIIIDGKFHLFYIRDQQKNFGHAVSEDLEHWSIMEPVLETGPEEWDIKYIWAPHVVPYSDFPGYLFMYYTGLNSNMAQQTCLAATTAPSGWEKASSLIFTPFHGDTAWMKWDQNDYSDFRDPCFFHDQGGYYLIQTARANNGRSALALSRSDDYLRWSDAGPLYVHNNSNILESAFLMKRDDIFHLFFTERSVGGISHMSSETLTGGWDIKTRRVIDGGHAAEITRTSEDIYIISRHTNYNTAAGNDFYSIRFDTLCWEGNVPQVNLSQSFQGNWKIMCGTAFQHQPVFRNNFAFRGDHSTDPGFEGDWWIGTSESFCGPMTGTAPGDYRGDEPRGEIRSSCFRIRGRSMRLLVGGGNYPDSCYIALCEAGTDRILCSETGRNCETMSERIWNLNPFRGKLVYLKIVDNCSVAFGHINVDGIRERMSYAEPPPDDGNYRLEPDKGLKKVRLDGEGPGENELPEPGPGNSLLKAKPPTPSQSTLSNYPNPFNPVTTIEVISAPVSRLEIILYSIAGKAVRQIPVRTDQEGRATVTWNGRDSRNHKLPAGVYLARLTSGSGILATHKLILIK